MSSRMTTVKLQFRAEHLDKKDFFGLGKSDPYLIIEKKTGGAENETYQQIHKTEYIRKDCSPTWKPFHLTFDEENPELKVKVYDWDKHSEDDFIGEFKTKLNDLLNCSEKGFDCLKEKKTGTTKNTGTIFLMYCLPAVGMKLSFRAKLATTTPKSLFLVITERYKHAKKSDEDIYRTEVLKTNSQGGGEWNVIETAVEDLDNTLQVQVFKSHQHSEPEPFGDFLMEPKSLEKEKDKFVDQDFNVNRKVKKEKTGDKVTLSLFKICKVPTSMSPSSPQSKSSIQATPPPSNAPPPPPPPPLPPVMKERRDDLQKTPNDPANPSQSKPMKPALAANEPNEPATTPSLMDEILKKKLKPVQPKDEDSAPKPKMANEPSMTNVLEMMRKAKGFDSCDEVEANDESVEWDEPVMSPPKRMKM